MNMSENIGTANVRYTTFTKTNSSVIGICHKFGNLNKREEKIRNVEIEKLRMISALLRNGNQQGV